MTGSGDDSGKGRIDLEHLVAEITKDARGDDEQLRAFHQALEGFGEPLRSTANSC